MDTLGSHLQISVEPAQSSFFAGEDFACTITFTNTREPVPFSAPLPSRATFETTTSNSPVSSGQDVQRRIVSSAAALQGKALSDVLMQKREHAEIAGVEPGSQAGPSSPLRPAVSSSKVQGLHSPMPSISLSPALGRLATHHRKSQSVDIRTYARRHQLEKSNYVEDENASDERYYRSLSEAAEREEQRYSGAGVDGDELDADDEEQMAMLHAQELFDSLPGRRNRIGKTVSTGRDTPKQLNIDPLPPEDLTTAKKHDRAISVAAAGYNLQSQPQVQQDRQRLLGIGHPEGASAAAFASPRLPSQRFPLEVISSSPQSSRGTSVSVRKASGPIAKTHPHSRKKSLAQVPAEDLSTTFELDGQIGTGGQSSEDSDMRLSSASMTPRASLDARGRPVENGFYGVGENATLDSVARDEITHLSRNAALSVHKFDFLALPGTETILWAFAHLNGHFVVDESLIKPGEFEHVKQKLAGVQSGLTGIGGGELGDVAEYDERNTARSSSNRGWGSYLRGAFSLGGDSGDMSAKAGGQAHRRTGSTLLDARSKTVTSRQIPVLTNPPTMLAVDLQLAPGQSKTFTFCAPLPPDIPPSYNGRAISFTYSLTLGTNRLAKGRRSVTEQKSRLARIPIRVYNHIDMSGVAAFFDLTNPIVNRRDDSSVTEIGQSDDKKLFPSHTSLPIARQDSNTSVSRTAKKADDALAEYTKGLLDTCLPASSYDGDANDASHNGDDLPKRLASTRLAEGTSPTTSPSSLRRLRSLSQADSADLRSRDANLAQRKRGQDITQAGLGLHMDDDDLPRSCLQAVEILSRNSQKVSYDISKDGQVTAVLTLIKSKYRLGDTVTGVVHINKADCIARVVRFAASLETHEEIEGTLGTLPAARAQGVTRVVYAKHNDSTLDTGQASFSLPISSGATPSFHTSAVRLAWTVRLSFLTLSNVQKDKLTAGKGLGPPPPHLIAGADDGYGAYHRILHAVPALPGPWLNHASPDITHEREAKLEIVECVVPLTVLPHSTRFTVGEVAYAA